MTDNEDDYICCPACQSVEVMETGFDMDSTARDYMCMECETEFTQDAAGEQVITS